VHALDRVGKTDSNGSTESALHADNDWQSDVVGEAAVVNANR
jgi:hypothetical protein